MNLDTVPPVGAPVPVPAWTALLAAALFLALGALDHVSPDNPTGPAARVARAVTPF